MKRSILMSLLVIGAVTALMGFTIAQFNDSETSENNTIATGSLDLKVDVDDDTPQDCAELGNDPLGAIVTISGAAPRTSDEDTICVRNDGTIDGILDADVSGLTDTEIGCNEPEQVAEGSPTCTAPVGELSENVVVDIWVEGDCNNVNADTIFDGNRMGGELWFFSGNMDGLAAFDFPPGDMPAGSQWCYGIETTVNAGADNKIQTDEVTADITFTLTQAP